MKKTEIIHVSGMSCTGCENIISKNLAKLEGVEQTDVSYAKGRLKVTYDPDTISLETIKQKILELGYGMEQQDNGGLIKQISGAALCIVALYILLRHTGIGMIFNLFPEAEAGMSYGMIFFVGVLTSVHCIAMCGGINLSQCMSSCTQKREKVNQSLFRSSFLYNLGRVGSYTLLGAIIGAAGSVISFSGTAKGIVQLLAGLFMIVMGLNMLNVFSGLSRFLPKMPQIFTKNLNPEDHSKRPLYVGLLNGFMPCGPLQAMQLYALSTSDPIKGALSMLLFGLGTVPLMFGIGVLSSLLTRKSAKQMMSVGAVLVVVLGGSMLMNGLSLAGITMTSVSVNEESGKLQSDIQNDVQTITTALSPRGYEPITVQAGVPVRWTIRAEKGTITGCNNRIFIPEYNIEKKLELGDNIIEFTPTEPGKYIYTCWMGMLRSTITVLPEGDNVPEPVSGQNNQPLYSPYELERESVLSDYVIPVDRVVTAEVIDDVQYVKTQVGQDGFSPALIILQRNVNTEWTIEMSELKDGKYVLLFPKYETVFDLTEGEQTLYLYPEVDFEFSTSDYRFYGYIKVVDDLKNIDLEAIQEEVQNLKLYQWDSTSSIGGSCCQ